MVYGGVEWVLSVVVARRWVGESVVVQGMWVRIGAGSGGTGSWGWGGAGGKGGWWLAGMLVVRAALGGNLWLVGSTGGWEWDCG